MKRKKRSERKRSFFKSQKFLTMLVGLFIVVLMAGSALNMWGEDEDQEENAYEIGGIKFVNIGYGWQGMKGTESFFMLNNPKDLENITIQYVDFSSLNSMEKIYISINPEDGSERAASLLQENIRLAASIVQACHADIPECADAPLKNCTDATESVAVIVFRKANETYVSLENNCLTIQGKNLLKLTDKAVLEYYLKRWE